MKKITRIPLLLALLGLSFLPSAIVQAQTKSPEVAQLTLDGPLTPVMVGYIQRGLAVAEQRGDAAVLVLLNTPGGSIDLMNTIVQDFLAAPVPVIVYVYPNGSMAASAGSLITMAGSVAVMAPTTTIGAASPVGSQGEDLGQTLETKQKEILMATARSLTERRGSSAVSLAQEMISKARAVSASEALNAGLVDFIATDPMDALAKADGLSVTVAGQQEKLITNGAVIFPVETNPIEGLLGMLINPNLVFLLLTIGVQALLIELSSPGGWVAGFIGAVCLLLAIYGLGILPVNWFGGLFLVLAFILFVVDIKAPTHGALTVAGAGSFIAGALVLFNSNPVNGYPLVSVPLVVGMSLLLAASFYVLVRIALRAMKKPVRTGKEILVGRQGFAKTDIERKGTVQIAGEVWTAELAEGEKPIKSGDIVQVTAVDGLRMIVKKGD